MASVEPVISPTPSSSSSGPACGMANAAFCETFDEGPAVHKGRGGDLDVTKWTTSRMVPDFSTGDISANPVRSAPIPACKASYPQTRVYPPFDTLICDPDAKGNRQLMTAVAVQNYGINSYMIQQPFDFANRTGKLVFDVDAIPGGLGAFVSVEITEDPIPASQFQEFHNYEAGPLPRNGVMIKMTDNCQQTDRMRLGNLLVYNNYVMTLITAPTFAIDAGNCPKIKPGFLNHFEVHLSQTHIDVYASDFSPDGTTGPNLRLIYSTDISVPFSRGYVHLSARNHATIKYGLGEDGVFHWDNIGFDGPVISGHKFFEIADNTTMGTYEGSPIMNLGYMLRDDTTGSTAGIYDPDNLIASLTIPDVDTTGSTHARLSLTAFFAAFHGADTTWGLKYRLNGGAWRTRTLTATEVTQINNQSGNPDPGAGNDILLLIDVPFSDIKNGVNTLEFIPVNAPMDYKPVVGNIDLVLTP